LSAATEAETSSPPVENELAEVVAYHNGDMRGRYAGRNRHAAGGRPPFARQLIFAEGAMGGGMTRGWRPSYDRD